MSTIQNYETDEIPQGFEGYVATIESTNKPWYLTSTAVYETVKKTVAAIPHSKALFDKSIDGIVALTNFINMKTGSNIVVIDHEKANELIDQLDDILGGQFIRVDDGFDNLRSKLANSLRRLIDSLVEQKKLAVATRNVLVAKVENARDVTTQSLTTRYEQAAAVFRALLDKVKTRCPAQVSEFLEKSYDTAEKKTHAIFTTAQATSTSWIDRGLDIYHNADSQFSWATAYILKTAQPYVHTAVQRGQPYLANAVEVSQPYVQPYVQHAKPFLDPLVERAHGVKHALEEHKVVGPYVARAYATAHKTLADVKVYCLSETDEEVQEVFGVVEGVNEVETEGVLYQEAELDGEEEKNDHFKVRNQK